MRPRSVALIALVALPVVSLAAGAQLPRPRVGRGTTPAAAPLPPEAPPVARALAYRRSRWQLEGYSMISTYQLQDANGNGTSFTGFGGGTRGGYRITDYLSGTADVSGVYGGGAIAGTVELGTRFSFMPHDQELRPYVDLRGAFVQMHDLYTLDQTGFAPGLYQQYTEGGRYSRGLGSVIGSGVEYQLRPSFAITTGISAMRARMSSYRFTGASEVPQHGSYWMTSYRYVLGLKYNAARRVNLQQNPAAR